MRICLAIIGKTTHAKIICEKEEKKTYMIKWVFQFINGSMDSLRVFLFMLCGYDYIVIGVE